MDAPCSTFFIYSYFFVWYMTKLRFYCQPLLCCFKAYPVLCNPDAQNHTAGFVLVLLSAMWVKRSAKKKIVRCRCYRPNAKRQTWWHGRYYTSIYSMSSIPLPWGICWIEWQCLPGYVRGCKKHSVVQLWFLSVWTNGFTKGFLELRNVKHAPQDQCPSGLIWQWL